MSLHAYFRMLPDLRRSAWYVLASSPLLAVVGFCVARFAKNASVAEAALHGGVICVVPALLAVLPLRWALRLDEWGMARRFLIRWDLWTWADLSSGRIEKRHPHTFYDPRRPWWRNRLSLEWLEHRNLRRALEVVNAHYRLPPPPEVPDAVELRYGNFFRRGARLDAHGLSLHGAQNAAAYGWRDVRWIRFTRMDALRRDFARLEISLPDREIELQVKSQSGATPNWKGASAEVVSEIFKRHLPPDRVVEDLAGERPVRRTDAEKELAKARKRCRDLRWVIWGHSSLLLGCLVLVATKGSVWKAAGLGGMLALILVPLYLGGQHIVRARCRELERQLASYE